jgi:Recombinase
MPKLRDTISGPLDLDLLAKRRAEGWRLTAIEWEREGDEAAHSKELAVPFGFRVAADCEHLEEDPRESEALRVVMRMVVDDAPLSRIADELNSRGLRTRSGAPWNPASVFRLMPGLVDQGPRIFSHPEWQRPATAIRH